MKKILVVDDEQSIRDLLKDKLVKSNFQVAVASSGQQALEMCKDELPDLLLIDIAMPEMDGYATCEKLKQDRKTSEIPVLFLTGKDLSPQGVIEHCRNLGACGHVSKLSTLKELLAKIEEITKEHTP
jgi:CheY-like chemotaxis protein